MITREGATADVCAPPRGDDRSHERRRTGLLHGLYVKRARISREENNRAASFGRQSPQTHQIEAIANNRRDGARCAETTSR
jgi:hypothetical protein